MKAGLFICDHVAKEWQHKFGDYPDMFAALFPEFEWVLYDVINGDVPEDLDSCDVYLATGSRHSAYDTFDWIDQLKSIIQEIHKRNKYFVGFCFGHQLMGEALGGQVGKSSSGWCVGVHEFQIIKDEEWMIPKLGSFNMLMMCQDQVLDLPPGAKLLAGSDLCPVGMYQVGERMLGIQAHPEFSKEYDQLLMEGRVRRMGEQVVAEGIASLKRDLHVDWFRNSVLNFINFQK